jgi:hypothetical protein
MLKYILIIVLISLLFHFKEGAYLYNYDFQLNSMKNSMKKNSELHDIYGKKKMDKNKLISENIH